MVGFVLAQTASSRHLAPIPDESTHGSLVSGVVATQLPSPQQVFGTPSFQIAGATTLPSSLSSQGGASWFFTPETLTAHLRSGRVVTLPSPVGKSDTFLAGTATDDRGAIVVFANQTPTTTIRVAVTADFGSTWAKFNVSLPTPVTTAWISSTDPHTAVMEAWNTESSSPPFIVTSTDSGRRWRVFQSESTLLPLGGEALTPTIAYERGTNGSSLWASTNDGLSWSKVTLRPHDDSAPAGQIGLPALLSPTKEVTADVTPGPENSASTLSIFVSTNVATFVRVGEITLTTDTANTKAMPIVSVVSPSVWEIAYGDELFGSTNQGKTWESVAATPGQAQILGLHVSPTGRGTLVDASHLVCAQSCTAKGLSLYTISPGSSEWGSTSATDAAHTALTVFAPVSVGKLASDISATPAGMWFLTQNSHSLNLGEITSSTDNQTLSMKLDPRYRGSPSLLPAPVVVGTTAWVATQHALFRVDLASKRITNTFSFAAQTIVSLADSRGQVWLALKTSTGTGAAGTVEELSSADGGVRSELVTPCPISSLVANSDTVTAEVSACGRDKRRQLDTIGSPGRHPTSAVFLPEAQSTSVEAEVGDRVWAFTSWSPTSLVGFDTANSSSYVSPLVPHACVGNDAGSGPGGLWISGRGGLCIVNVASNTVTYLTGTIPAGARVLSLAGTSHTEWVATSAGIIEIEAALAAS